ncbi:hypothetical protein LSAT2_011583 [Lamellibrachia satsuma]|nr:hypothetical protein LSAT2_011583 [Lamellibrachia satsuma]
MADSAKNWNKFTIVQLKAELGRRNLDIAGKKADLVNRLVQADAEISLEDGDEEMVAEQGSDDNNEDVTEEPDSGAEAADDVNNDEEMLAEPTDDVTDAEESALLGNTDAESEADSTAQKEESKPEKMDTPEKEKDEIVAADKPKASVATRPKTKPTAAAVKRAKPAEKKADIKKTDAKKSDEKKTDAKKSDEKKTDVKKTDVKKTDTKKGDEKKKSDADEEKDKKAEKNARPRHNVFVPDKRQMRIDMVVDHRLKTVCVFPITTADMLKPEIQALYDKCVSVGTVFYNGKDENGELVEQGYMEFHFESYEEAENVKKILGKTTWILPNDQTKKKSADTETDGAPCKKQKLDDSKTEEPEVAAEKEDEEAEGETKEAEEEEVVEPGLLEKCNMSWFRGVRAFPHPRSQLDGVLYISNLPESATEQALLQLFTDASGVFIARGEDHKPKGYACVDYVTMEAAFEAVDKMADNAELDGNQLIVHSLMPKPDECIPADESTEIDSAIDSETGIMPTEIKDMLVKRIRELRTKLIEAKEEGNTDEMTALDKRIINVRQRLSKDNRLRSQHKWKTSGSSWYSRGRGDSYRSRGMNRDSGYRGRWQNSSSSYHVSSSRSAERVTPYRKRPRDESWSSPSDRGYSSSRYSRGGRDYSSYGRQSGGGNDPMNLLVGLSQMLSSQLQNQSHGLGRGRYQSSSTSDSYSRSYGSDQQHNRQDRYSSDSRWQRHY